MRPLHDDRIEQALLALVALLSARDPAKTRDLVLGLGIGAEDFARPGHQAIWSASLGILARGHAVESAGLAAELSRQGLRASAAELLDVEANADASSSSEAAPLATRIRELSLRRRLAEAADRLRALADDPSQAPDLSALDVSGSLASLGGAGAESTRTLRDSLMDYLARLEQVERGERMACVPTGIEIWDELLGGLQAGVVTFIGAQPSVGKSALVGTMARGIAQAGHVVGLFSLEDDPEWLAERAVAWDSGVPVHRLATARLYDGESGDVQAAAGRVHDWGERIRVDGRSGLTARQVAATARQMIAQHGARAIIVDHLGELALETRRERHDLAVTDAVQQLRDVAKDTGVPVVVCAHFARPPKSNDEPRYQRPTSSSWANSAGLERMARVAVGLWLPKPEDGVSKNEVIATVLKQTRGDKDFDFTLRLHRPSGLISTTGGKLRGDGQPGHHEAES